MIFSNSSDRLIEIFWNPFLFLFCERKFITGLFSLDACSSSMWVVDNKEEEMEGGLQKAINIVIVLNTPN